jgi:hypothetical protein
VTQPPKKYQLEPGTIIEATNLMTDIIPALMDAWRSVDLRRCAIFEAANANEIAAIGEENEDTDYTQWMYEEIIKELETYAPMGYYIGNNEGDASDLGVWPLDFDTLTNDWPQDKLIEALYDFIDGEGLAEQMMEFLRERKQTEADQADQAE